MRVLHFLDTVGRGGAEMQALDVCGNARDFGIEMTVVTAGGGVLEDDFRNSGADFIRLSRSFPIDPRLVFGLRKIIIEKEIRIVHGYQAVDNLHLYLAARKLKDVKQVMSFQGYIPDRKNFLATKFLIPRMDANIVVSLGLKAWLENDAHLDTSRNFHLIYNGVDVKRLQPTGRSVRQELGLSDKTLLFGMIGNFTRYRLKDQMTLCRALPKVFSKLEKAHCLFAGRIQTGAEAKFEACTDFCRDKGILDRVHFLGARSDVPDILNAIDLFVFSSLHEGLPLAVAEAMLAGVPAILSGIEPLLEVSDRGNCAAIFPPRNSDILSEKILELLNDEARRKDLADRARVFAEKNFSIEAHLDKLKGLYDSLTGARASRAP